MRRLVLLLLLPVAILAVGCDVEPDDPRAGEPPDLASSLEDLPPGLDSFTEPWTGDLDGMVERRMIRVLTVFNPMYYFLDGPRQRGIVYEAMAEFERVINRKLRTGRLRIRVVMIPVTRDRLIPSLVEGRGDIAAANLTITPERSALVDFTRPVLDDVAEVLVTGPKAPEIASLDDLAGQELHVRRSSSYRESIQQLDAVLEGRGLEPIHTVEVDERYEDHDILEMVNAGLLPMTVVDRHKARFWDQFFDRIEVREDLLLREGGEIAWAMRKDSPRLAETLNAFVRDHRKGTLFGNVVFDRYLEQTHWVEQALDTEDRERFDRLAGLFRKYAGEYDLDWLLVAAQAYQESGLDPDRRSRAGAVGVMQLRPAAAREVGIEDVRGVEDNIHAGVKYLRHVMDRYFDDESLDPFERQLFGLAAYNAGPSRIRALRGKTAEAGLDPDRWFGNVEVLAARHVGSEPVRYVGNITKYYLAFALAGPDLESPDAVIAYGATR